MKECKCKKKKKCNFGRDLLVLLGAGVVAGVVALAVVDRLANVDYEDFDEQIRLAD